MIAAIALGLVLAAGQSATAAAPTRFVKSPDGTRIAYDDTGSGPAVMLLHGGGQTRQVWRDAGYVTRLAPRFRVITVDLRGNGESDKPATKAAYALDRLIEDLLAVADDAKAQDFSLWGFSYGANVRPLSRRTLDARHFDGVHRHPVRSGRGSHVPGHHPQAASRWYGAAARRSLDERATRIPAGRAGRHEVPDTMGRRHQQPE